MTFFILRENILKLKEEFYKPRDLAEDEELENIVDAILKQKAMAMDTGYVADVGVFSSYFVCSNSLSFNISLFIHFFFFHIKINSRLQNITIASKTQVKKMSAPMYLR